MPNLNGKKVLITGASGLIGVHLIESISNGDIYTWTKNEIDIYLKDKFNNCNIIQRDITDINSFNDLPKFDIIIHSAGYGQPGKFLDDKIKTIQLNTTSTIELFKKLKTDGKFLFVSTSELYNGLNNFFIKETDIGTTNTDHFRSCYIEGKRCGESICHSYKERGYDVKIARLCLAYGEYTKRGDHRVLNSLIEKAIKNNKIELMDNGDAIRTYCYVKDVVDMFWNILLNGKDVTYNVGGDSKLSILDLAKKIGLYFNKEVIVPEINNEILGNPKIVNISIDKYLNEFGCKQFLNFDDGLRKTIEWQKYIYENTNK